MRQRVGLALLAALALLAVPVRARAVDVRRNDFFVASDPGMRIFVREVA